MSFAGRGIDGPVALIDSVGGTELLRHSKAQVIASIFAAVTVANIKGLWLFDVASGTTLQDRGTLNHDATLSADANTQSPSVAGLCPHLQLNGDLFTVADHADFTFGNGAADSAFSLIILVNPLSGGFGASQEWITKYAASNTEYGFNITAGNFLSLALYDDSAGATISRRYNSSLATDAGTFHTYISTYSGSAASSGIKVYRDGTRVDDTDSNTGIYVAMENKTAAVGNFYNTNLGPGKGKIGCVSVIAEELTAAQVQRIDMILRGYAGVSF